MPNTTSRLLLQEPLTSDPDTGLRTAITANATTLDNAVLVTEGTISARPLATAVEKDHIYKATDTGIWYVSDGTNWNTMMIAGAWVSLASSLGTGLSAGAGWGAASVGYRQIGDSLELFGAIENTSGSTITASGSGYAIATGLPAPTVQQAVLDAPKADNTVSNGGFVTLSIGFGSHRDYLYMMSGGTLPANYAISLDGLRYRLI